jgi:hypothetical protein
MESRTSPNAQIVGSCPRFGTPDRCSRRRGLPRTEELENIPEQANVAMARPLDNSPYRTQSRIYVFFSLSPRRTAERHRAGPPFREWTANCHSVH